MGGKRQKKKEERGGERKTRAEEGEERAPNMEKRGTQTGRGGEKREHPNRGGRGKGSIQTGEE